MTRRLLSLVLLAAVAAGAVYLRYGAISPCGILRVRIREEAAAQRGAAAALAMILPDQAIDALLAAQYGPLTPLRCTAILMGEGKQTR